MIAAALVTEAQQTQRAVTALIILLLVVAAMLALLTFWYWRHTNPRRNARRFVPEFEQLGPDLRDANGYPVGYEVSRGQNWIDADDGYGRDPVPADPYREARRRHLT